MKATVLCLLLLFFNVNCKKKSIEIENETLPDVELKSKIIVGGLTNPWELVYGADGMIWFTEKAGKISRLNPQNGTISTVFTIPDVRVNGEAGLLGMALHPDFTANPFVYVVYDYGTNYKAKVVRYTYSGGALGNPTVLIDQISASSIHNGSRLLISGTKLFISTGDASDQSLPQNTNSLSGKILRLNLDGTIPGDNPFQTTRLELWSP